MRSPAHLLPAATGLTLLLLHLAYVQFNDTYLAALLPFALLALAPGVQAPGIGRRWWAATALWSLALLAATAVWMRGDFNRQQAHWDAAESVRQRGVAPSAIGGPLHWAETHGAFDDWLAAGASGFDPQRRALQRHGQDFLHGPFYRWLAERNWRAGTWILPAPEGAVPPAGWKETARFDYRGPGFERRSVWVLERVEAR